MEELHPSNELREHLFHQSTVLFKERHTVPSFKKKKTRFSSRNHTLDLRKPPLGASHASRQYESVGVRRDWLPHADHPSFLIA